MALTKQTRPTATQVTLSQSGDVQDAVKYVTPEMFKTSSNTYTDAWRAMLASTVNVIHADGDYVLIDNIIIPSNKTIIFNGHIVQDTPGTFTWSEGNRRSNYPLFKTTGTNVTLTGSGVIENKFEAFCTDTGSSDIKIIGITIRNPARSQSVGLSLYNTDNLLISGCTIANNGSLGTYSPPTSVIGRYGHAIDFGGVNRITITDNHFLYNGGCGAWCYGAGDVVFSNNTCVGNAYSGIQYGPNPNYSGLVISNNIFRYNFADGIDINNTAASPLPIRATISGNVSIQNGFYQGDTTKPTVDGSGVATLRMVSDFTCTGNYSLNCNGVGVYMTSVSNGIVSNNVILNSVTGSSGIFQGFSSTDISIMNNTVSVIGTAYQEAGSTPILRLRFRNNKLTSTGGSTISLPSNTRGDVMWGGNHHTTAGLLNYWFSCDGEQIRYTGSATRAVYFNGNFSKVVNMTINGTTSGDMLYVDGGTQNHFQGLVVNNLGSGRAMYVNNCTYLTIENSLIQCTAGTAVHFENGSNIGVASCSITGGTAISAPNAAPVIYFSGRMAVTGTQTYGTKPYDAQYIQRP